MGGHRRLPTLPFACERGRPARAVQPKKPARRLRYGEPGEDESLASLPERVLMKRAERRTLVSNVFERLG
jgi:hypothetical protein